jgi:hypothetical protein
MLSRSYWVAHDGADHKVREADQALRGITSDCNLPRIRGQPKIAVKLEDIFPLAVARLHNRLDNIS